MVNAGAQEGLEAWRALVLHHEPTSLTRNAGVLQELLNFSFEGEIAARIIQLDRDIDRYEKARGENFPNNIRIGFALRMLQDGILKQHLVLSSARLTTWETLKAEIDNVRRAQAAASSTPQPMHGPFSVWYPGTRCFSEGQPEVARQGQRQKAHGRHPENAMSHLREEWPLEARLLAQRGESEAQRKGQRWQRKEPCLNTATTVRQRQERCEVLELRCSRTYCQKLPEEEAEFVGCGESNTIIRSDF